MRHCENDKLVTTLHKRWEIEPITERTLIEQIYKVNDKNYCIKRFHWFVYI